jgi:hypothetical protein
MPSFSWTGRFREGQWRAYRKFILEERRDASKRELAILSEIGRIGDVTIRYGSTNGVTNETRLSITVEPDLSSLGKLFSAYVSLGGNPFDVSMFLSPDKALPTSVDGQSSQPSGGVSTSVGFAYSYGGLPTTSDSTIQKFKPSRSGGPVITPDGPTGDLVMRSRNWVSKEIKFKRNAIEHRILKLCDLREQLEQELDDLCWAVRGYGVSSMIYDESRYDDDLTVAKIVYTVDSIYHVPSEDGTVSVTAARNADALAAYPNLMDDVESGEEANTAL